MECPAFAGQSLESRLAAQPGVGQTSEWHGHSPLRPQPAPTCADAGPCAEVCRAASVDSVCPRQLNVRGVTPSATWPSPSGGHLSAGGWQDPASVLRCRLGISRLRTAKVASRCESSCGAYVPGLIEEMDECQGDQGQGGAVSSPRVGPTSLPFLSQDSSGTRCASVHQGARPNLRGMRGRIGSRSDRGVVNNRRLSNNGLHQTGRGGAAVLLCCRPVVEARPAGEAGCSTGSPRAHCYVSMVALPLPWRSS